MISKYDVVLDIVNDKGASKYCMIIVDGIDYCCMCPLRKCKESRMSGAEWNRSLVYKLAKQYVMDSPKDFLDVLL